MPYGLPKDLRTKENEKWIEDCVESVQNENKDVSKEQAIRICKKQLINGKGNKAKATIKTLNKIKEIKTESKGNKIREILDNYVID